MRRNVSLGLALAIFGFTTTAWGSFHQWGISEVYSDPTGTIQFIEMATSQPGEIFLQFNQFTSIAKNLTFDHNFGSATTNKKFLMATPGYAALPGVPAPDFTFPSNNFFSVTADTLTLVGGIGDGVHPATLSFTSGQLPIDGVKSLNFDLSQNTTNSPTNFAGTTGAVPEPATAALLGTSLSCLMISRRRRARRPS